MDVHTNIQEGIWHHTKSNVKEYKDLDSILIDFMFMQNFNASSGVTQVLMLLMVI